MIGALERGTASPGKVGEGCIIMSGCSGFACQHSYGLSIYFPWGVVSPDYENLVFAKDAEAGGTGWRGFLQAHLKDHST